MRGTPVPRGKAPNGSNMKTRSYLNHSIARAAEVLPNNPRGWVVDWYPLDNPRQDWSSRYMTLAGLKEDMRERLFADETEAAQ